MTTIVRLKRSYGLNNLGEVCGFSDAEAESLVAAGAAEKLSAKEVAAIKKAKASGKNASLSKESVVSKRETKDKPKGAKDK